MSNADVVKISECTSHSTRSYWPKREVFLLTTFGIPVRRKEPTANDYVPHAFYKRTLYVLLLHSQLPALIFRTRSDVLRHILELLLSLHIQTRISFYLSRPINLSIYLRLPVCLSRSICCSHGSQSDQAGVVPCTRGRYPPDRFEQARRLEKTLTAPSLTASGDPDDPWPSSSLPSAVKDMQQNHLSANEERLGPQAVRERRRHTREIASYSTLRKSYG